MPLDTLTGYPLGALSHTQRVPGRGSIRDPLSPGGRGTG
jgi:hypothetical protein